MGNLHRINWECTTMSSKTSLKILFSCILLTLLIYTVWASSRQPVLQWGGLTSGTDRYWTIATQDASAILSARNR
jgi:hypothetical protein